jgi:hypothetical protein
VRRDPSLSYSGWLLLCTMALAPAVAGAQEAVRPKAAWALMVYLDADNDLERPIINNLKEVLEAGSTGNVIVLAARSPKSTSPFYANDAVGGLDDWSSTKLLRVERGPLTELDDCGERDMADPKMLTDFPRYAAQNYPARRDGAILGDHGTAWAGIAVTDSHRKNTLALALIDLGKIPAVDGTVARAGAGADVLLARKSHDDWVRIGKAHHRGEEYGRSGSLPGTGRSGAEAEAMRRMPPRPCNRAAPRAVLSQGAMRLMDFRG